MVIHDGGHVLALADFGDEDFLFLGGPVGAGPGEGNEAGFGEMADRTT
jgi:hypothetical protein